jgi:hypothetical protein
MCSSTFSPLLRGHARVAIRQPSEQKKRQVKNSKEAQNSWASYALRPSKNADACVHREQKQKDITETEPSKKRHTSIVQPPWNKQPLCLESNIHITQQGHKPKCDDL